ncbi:MAG: TIGR01548 family HAD-type hydrolase [Cyanobacteria bacterium P01_D01_bin.1]
MKPFAIAIFDIDGVIRDVGGSYRRAIADTVEHYTHGSYRPTIEDIDRLKSEGVWNNDWKASEEMIRRYCTRQQEPRPVVSYEEITDYFQRRYRGPDTEDPDQWTGYISSEPLLVDKDYLERLYQSGIPYAFFSGATRGSASFVLKRRIGIDKPILIAMEDAPGKPDPTGLMMAVRMVENQQSENQQSENQQSTDNNLPVVYAGDTAADMQTIAAAKQQFPDREWLAIGILPPHAQKDDSYKTDYAEKLKAAGAIAVLESVQQINAAQIQNLL